MRIHFIAIGGSAMHNMAIALHKKGFEVTGSDDVLFEPSISRLAKYGLLPEKEGWYPEKITNDIDAVILGMHARVDNPELLKAQELGIKIYSYPEYIYEHIVIEGDEYLSSAIDRRPKFHLYKANIGVISGIAWDHINVFPTFENYTEQFRIFIETIEPEGKLIYCETDNILTKVVGEDKSKVEKISYGLPAYNIKYGITNIIYNSQEYPLQVFGEHNLMNMEAARLVCENLGITSEEFYRYISSFKGAARRLELVGKNETANFFKDFAHSPSKLTATIHAVKAQFPERKLVACIELHTFSSLNEDFLSQYSGSMDDADTAIVFIDKKTFEHKKMTPYGAETVKKAFSKNDLLFFNDPADLLKYLENIDMKGKNLLMMSSGNFGGIDLPALSVTIL